MSEGRPVDGRAPVLVGVGITDQREDDPSLARDAVTLMLDAVRAAAADARCLPLLGQIDLVAVPRGQWRYGDPGRHLATTVGSPGANSVLAVVGVLQQTLIGEACRRIADGTIDVALVVGGEARYRRLREKITGIEAGETQAPGEPDELLEPEAELVLPSEVQTGLGGMPVGYYAVIESARRAALGLGVDEHRDRIAARYARFSEVAAANPHAWRRQTLPPGLIRGPSAENPMLAFPYTKLHNSSWNVDQAAALLLCSAAKATELGIPPSRWVFPRASTESNHMTAVSERAELARSPGARLAGRRALELGGVEAGDLDFAELYTCFPAAVELHAAELGIPDDVDWTVTGAMPFAGGPFNNYVLQSTGRMIELLRERPGTVGLVSSVSGVMTKHGFGVWSTDPGPHPFASVDVTGDVAAATERRPVVGHYEGPATVAGCTVVHTGGRPEGVALLDLPGAARAMTSTVDPAVIHELETRECVGRSVDVGAGRFSFGSGG